MSETSPSYQVKEDPLKDKTILLTGGTGSFGQEFCKIALQKYSPKVIRIYSRSEFLQWEMQNKLKDSRLRFLIGDVRDKDRLWRACQGVDLIIHAAALKQIPTAEYNPIECVKTNVNGAVNIVDCAIDAKVPKVLALSTDKACHPVNLYGATKSVMEKIIVQGNSYSKDTRLSCTRYGNVSWSRGSIIHLFHEQRKTGCLSITDDRMTRYWMTLSESVYLVILALSKMVGGEIFIPKLPSVRVVDIAESVAPDVNKIITGIRPGEKLYESLVTEEECSHTRDMGDYFVVEPEHPFWTENTKYPGSRVEKEYRSDTNPVWIGVKEIQEYLLTNDINVL